jgi:hypothetical protein
MDIKSEVEYMHDYMRHLEWAQNRLLETYNEVRKDSAYIANEIWRDAVSESFMDMLDIKQKDLKRIAEALEHYREVIRAQIEVLEKLESQPID